MFYVSAVFLVCLPAMLFFFMFSGEIAGMRQGKSRLGNLFKTAEIKNDIDETSFFFHSDVKGTDEKY